MKTYFVTTDCHSHFTVLKAVLAEKGFQEENEEHILLFLGDAFDRGEEPEKVYGFFRGLAEKNRLIWILGNHEYQLISELEKGTMPHQKDTYETAKRLAESFAGRKGLTDAEMFSVLKEEGVLNFLKANIRPYFETNHYVFVHGSLPAAGGKLKENWRQLLAYQDWGGACKNNGMRLAVEKQILPEGKTLVCGHTKAAYGNVRRHLTIEEWAESDREGSALKKELDAKAMNFRKYPEFFCPYEGHGCIGLDGWVTKTGHMYGKVITETEA